MTRSLSPLRLAFRLVGWIVVTLVAIEVALQVGALVVSWMKSPPASSGSGGVLCIGDSFTFGFGADDPANSYPRELDRRLAAEGLEIQVVNSGWPGRDSAEVLRRLPEQLDDYSPKLVYVLVGYNDFWSGQAEEPGFWQRLRTVRLGRLVWHWAAGTLDQDQRAGVERPEGSRGPDGQDPDRPQKLAVLAEAPFAGTWHAGPLWLEFRLDSSIHSSSGNLPFMWNWNGETILLSDRVTDRRTSVDYRLDGDRLRLNGGPFGSGLDLERGRGQPDALDRARAERRAGNLQAADALLSTAVTSAGPRSDEALQEQVDLRLEGARTADLAELLPALQTRFAGPDPSARCGLALIRALIALERSTELEPAISRFVRTQAAGQSQALLRLLEREAPDQVGVLQEQVLASLRDESLPVDRLADLWALHVLLDPEDGTRHAGALVAGLRLDIDNTKIRRILTRSDRCSREEFFAEIERQEPDDRRRDVMRAAFEDAKAGRDETPAVLWKNLRSILDECRARGAEVVLLNYPNGRDDLARLYREFGAEFGVTAIDVHGEFRRRIDDDDWDEHFIFDGHCNDRGYQLMGQIVAEDARTRL